MIEQVDINDPWNLSEEEKQTRMRGLNKTAARISLMANGTTPRHCPLALLRQ